MTNSADVSPASWAAPGAASAAPSRGAAFAPPPPPAPSGPARGGAAPIDVPTRRLGWTPPPKRGLLPLRPIPVGQLLGAPFRLQRRAPRVTLAPALLLSLVTTVVAQLAQWGLLAGPRAALDTSYDGAYPIAQNRVDVLAAAASWLPLVAGLAGAALLGGIVAVPASRALLAERVSVAGLRRRLRGRTARLVGWALLVLTNGTAVLAVATLLPYAVAVSMGYTGTLLATLVAIPEFIVVFLVGGLLAARLGPTGVVIALEGLSIRAAVQRSWRLTRGSGWRLYGIQLLVWTIVGIAASGLTAPLDFMFSYGGGLVFPNGATSDQGAIYDLVATVVTTAATVVTGAFGLVLQSGTAALLTLDLRMRREGLDHELARYVDERQRGVAVADPFPAPSAKEEATA